MYRWEEAEMAGFKRYLKNTGWLFLSRVAGMGVSFLVGVRVARYLGPTSYGLLNYAAGFTGLFLYFVIFSTENILNRELVLHPDKRDALLGTGFISRLAGAFLAVILIGVSLFFMPDNAGNLLIIISASTFFFQAIGVIDIYFQSQVLSKNTVKIQIFTMATSAVLKLLFVSFGFDLIWFAMMSLLEGIITAAGLMSAYRRLGLKIWNWQFDFNIAKKLVSSSWPLVFSGIAIAAYTRIDQVLIQNMLGSAAVGTYAAAVKLAEIWYIVPVVICSSLFPAIINAKKTNEAIYQLRLSRLYSLMFWLAVLIVIPVYLFPDLIIKVLFGSEYFGAGEVLRIYILSCVPLFLWMAINQYLISENYIKTNLYQSVVMAIVNIFLNLILVPKIGIVGGAYATFFAYCAGLFCYALPRTSRKQFVVSMKSVNPINMLRKAV